MDWFTGVLAGLLGRSAGLLPAARREWAEAVLAEAGEVPAGAGRVAWLCGGLWLVAREVVMGRVIRVLAFAAGAVGLVWIGWPGASSNSATPLNRVYVTVTVVLLAVLPWVVRRYFGPVRGGWAPRAARVGGYAMVLALIAAKAVKDRDGSKLGAYFVVVPGLWVLEIVLLLVIVGYVAGLLILTSERVRLTRSGLPIGIGFGAVTAGVLYALAPLGVKRHTSPPSPLAGQLVGAGLAGAARGDRLPGGTIGRPGHATRRPEPHPAGLPGRELRHGDGCPAAGGAHLGHDRAVPAPRAAPGTPPRPPPGGGCETCDPNNTVIPPGLRHEYWVEISVGQAGQTPLAALLIAPFLGAGLGALGGGLARRSPGTRGRGGGPHALHRLRRLSRPAASGPPTPTANR